MSPSYDPGSLYEDDTLAHWLREIAKRCPDSPECRFGRTWSAP